MTNETKTCIGAGVLIAAALIWLKYFYKKPIAPAAATENGGGGGGGLGGFAGAAIIPGVALVNDAGTVLAVVPANNAATTTPVTPSAPNTPATLPNTANCQTPTISSAYLDASRNLIVGWSLNGSNYNAVTVWVSVDGGANWRTSTTGPNLSPMNLGNRKAYDAQYANQENILVKITGNCQNNVETPHSAIVSVPVALAIS